MRSSPAPAPAGPQYVCETTNGSPHANTVRGHLTEQFEPDSGEAVGDTLLQRDALATLPDRPLEVCEDLHLHLDPSDGDEDETEALYFSQAKRGTTVEDTPDKPPLNQIEPENCVGVDLGITSYIHTSENLSVDMLELSNEYDRYAREQRKLDRKEHGSANWEKQRRKVAQAKRTIKRKVCDYQHKLTTWLVQEYDVVAVEDLDIKPMLEASQNAKNKQDAAWSRFLELLEYN